MKALLKQEAAISRWMVGAAVMVLAATPAVSARAQVPEPTKKDPAIAAPADWAVLLPKARQLQRDGDLQGAEKIARFDLTHHSDLSQLAGSWELLTSIYKQSGRYEEALTIGTRYQQLLEKIPNADASKRQDSCLMLAEILASLGKYPQAVAQVDESLKIANGWRSTDRLWETRAFALRAQIEHAAGENEASRNDWREVETRARHILDRISQTGPNVELDESALKLLAEALMATDRTPEVITVREQYLARYQDEHDRAREWSEIAKCHAILGQEAQEEHALRQAVALDTKHRNDRSKAENADLLDRLGIVLEHRGDVAGAQRQWKDAAAGYQDLVERSTGRRHKWERRLGYLAKQQAIFEELHQWPDAIRVGQQMLEHRSRTLLPDDPKLCRIKSTLAGLYARIGDTEQAHPLLEETLAYWRGRAPAAIREIAQTLIQLSKVSLNQGDRDQASAYAEDAVKAFEQASTGQASKGQALAGHELQLAEAHGNLAGILASEGHYQSAVDQYGKAAKIYRDRPDDIRASRLLSGTLVNIGMVYKSQHEYRRAAEYCAQALEILQKSPVNNSSAMVGLYTALASLQLAADESNHASKESGELEQAEKNVRAARRLCQEQGMLEGSAGVGVLELEAVLDVRRDKIDSARKSLDEALKLARQLQHNALEAKILTQLTELELRHGSPARAAELAGETLQLDGEMQAHPSLGSTAYLNLAQADRKLGQHEHAIEALRQAIRVVEVPDAATTSDSERAEFRSQIRTAIDLLVEWNVADGRLEDALSAVDGSDDRNLLDRMRTAQVDLAAPLASTHGDLQRVEGGLLATFRQQTAALRRVCAKPVVGDNGKQGEARQITKELDELRSQYTVTEAEIDQASPIYHNLLGSPQASQWPQLAHAILQPDNAALLYYLGQSQSYLFAVDGRTGTTKYFALTVSADLAKSSGLEPGPLTRGAAVRIVGDYLKHVRDGGPQARGEKSKPMALDTQLAIAEALLPAEARKWVAKVAAKRLIMVPDGAIDQLPLESLLIARPTTYVDDVFPPISYAASAAVMANLAGRPADVAPSAVSLLSVGDPAYPQANTKDHKEPRGTIGATYRSRGGQFGSLPGTIDECHSVEKAIAAAAPSSNRLVLTGKDATESNVRAHIGGRRFVHLATHGLVDQRHGQVFGAISLTQTADSTPTNDGFLTVAEICGLPLSGCELVVLSHCQAQAGAGRPLEAGSLLADSLLAAGAGSVVYSQWATDEATAAATVGDLFQTVSQQVRAGGRLDVAAALQKARRHVRKHAEWNAPYFWAPLVFSGPSRMSADHGGQLSSAR